MWSNCNCNCISIRRSAYDIDFIFDLEYYPATADTIPWHSFLMPCPLRRK